MVSYDYVEAISVGLLLKDVIDGAQTITLCLLGGVLDSWQLGDGHFVNRIPPCRRNIMPYHRWTSAHVFLALSTALAKRS